MMDRQGVPSIDHTTFSAGGLIFQRRRPILEARSLIRKRKIANDRTNEIVQGNINMPSLMCGYQHWIVHQRVSTSNAQTALRSPPPHRSSSTSSAEPVVTLVPFVADS